MSGVAVRQLAELLKDSGATVQFGLRAQGHLPTIRTMLADGASWEAIGDAIGWHGPTAQKHFQWEEFADAVLAGERSRLREKVQGLFPGIPLRPGAYTEELGQVVALPSRMDRSLADFARALRVRIEIETSDPNPDTALLALLCDAGRLGYEFLAVVTSDRRFEEGSAAALREVLALLDEPGEGRP